MGDESREEYEQYMAALPKADVVWLHGCKTCEATGLTPEQAVCHDCVRVFKCPQCGHKHGRPFFAALGEVLERCWVCSWSRHEKNQTGQGRSARISQEVG